MRAIWTSSARATVSFTLTTYPESGPGIESISWRLKWTTSRRTNWSTSIVPRPRPCARRSRSSCAPPSARGLGHPDPRGAAPLRNALAAYLGRQRGVVTTADRIVVTNGFWQALGVVCTVLVARGAKRLAMEDPSFVYHRHIAKRAGLEVVPV